MSSVQSLSHHPNVERLAKAMRSQADASRARALDQAITPDGRVRADRMDGFVDPRHLPLDALERGEIVTINPGSVASGRTVDVTVAIATAHENDVVTLGPPSTLGAGLVPFAFVSATGVVTIRILNATASTVDPASGEWRILVTR